MQRRSMLFGVATLAAAAAAAGGAGTSAAGTQPPALVNSDVGTYYGEPLVIMADVVPLACANPGSQATSFTTSIPSNWTTLDARSGPFQGCSVTGTWHTGDAFHVGRITYSGQKICRGRLDGRASTVWYHTPRGWSWSGGTSDPVWNTSC